MGRQPETLEYRGSYWFGFLVIALVAIRGTTLIKDSRDLVVTSLLLGSFTLLYICSPWLQKRASLASWFKFVYFPVQAALIFSLGLLYPTLDVTNLLYTTLALQVFHAFSRRLAIIWVAGFAILQTTTLVLGSGWIPGIILSLFYLASLAFMVSYDVTLAQAKVAQAESQALLGDLQVAHQQLKDYADQAGELAMLRERERLAREIHDSVSQLIFSITLEARSAQIMLGKDPLQVPSKLDHLQEMTQAALAEMRSLIAHLHAKA